jgi:hypothetical protein
MNIEVPTPSTELLTQLETTTTETIQSETIAVTAIRERFAPFPRHNGHIKIGKEWQSTSNSSWERNAYLSHESGKMHGLVCVDNFTESTNRGDQNRGQFGGEQLYVTQTGEWLEITRTGHWSNWQGEGGGWACGDVPWSSDEDYCVDRGYDGCIKTMTDAEVGAQYNLDEILDGLAAAMATMCQKLPDRLTRIKARGELAQRIISALK